MAVDTQKICFCIMVPVYRVENYLEDCIKSVLEQTYPEFRLILVDDGSPDRCGEICDSYAEKDARITVVHQRNQGQLSARCTGLNEAKKIVWDGTPYAIFLDSDDSLKRNALATIAQGIQAYQSDLLFYGIDLVQNGKKVGEHGKIPPQLGVVEDKRIFLKTVLLDSAYNSLCRKAVSFELLNSKDDYSSLFHVKYGEDLLQSLPFYRDCERPAFIEERLYNYTVNPDSMTHSIDAKKYSTNKFVRECTFKLLEQTGVFTDKDYEDYRAYCAFLIVSQLKIIAGLDASMNVKKNFMEQLAKTDFYQIYLKNKPYTRQNISLLENILYWMFTTRQYSAILYGLTLGRKRNLKHGS